MIKNVAVALISTLILVPNFAFAQTATKSKKATAKKSAIVTGRSIAAIEIVGNKKIEKAAILEKLTLQVGSPLVLDDVRDDIRRIFATGYFYDVTAEQQNTAKGLVLTFKVVERPSMGEILFEGQDDVDSDELLETSGLKPFEILSHSKLNEAVDKIQKLYEEKGFFLAQITYRTEDITAGESVRVIFKVRENDKVKVKKITILGNRALPDAKIKANMETQEGGFFSFISGSGAYKQDSFDRDLQRLNFIYLNEGFAQVKIDRPQVAVSADKKNIFVTLRVSEGERYEIGDIDFAGDLLFTETELSEGLETVEGEQFSYSKLQADLMTVQAKYGDLGYAYANVIPRNRFRDGEKKVDLTFEIDKGNKVYIGRINVKGNANTRDKVVRRELRIREGELYHETRKRESVDNVRRLGFFEEVNFIQRAPNEDQTRMDIDVSVKERNTGTIQVGAGYASQQGFIFNGQVSQINLMGKGQRLTASIDFAQSRQIFSLNFVEPYFMDTEWELGFEAYQSKRTLTEYEEDKTGGAVSVGHPLAPYLTGRVRYKLDDTELTLDPDDGDPQLYPVETANGLTSSATFTLAYDKRNDRFMPTKGIFSSLSIEYAGLGGDLEYTKGLAAFRYYKKVFWDLVWRNNVNYGFISSNNDEDPPFNELFLLGGANSLRGYDWYNIGKRKKSNLAYSKAISAGYSGEEAERRSFLPFGGTQQFFLQSELQFPLISEAGFQGVVFYDIGDAQDGLVAEEFRSNVGFGFRWFSPIGPLRFEWGFPFARKKEFDEQAVNFQFAIGSPF